MIASAVTRMSAFVDGLRCQSPMSMALDCSIVALLPLLQLLLVMLPVPLSVTELC